MTHKAQFNCLLGTGMTITIDEVVKIYDKLQQNKIIGSKNYGKVPSTDNRRVFTWNMVHYIDLSGLWTFQFKLIDMFPWDSLN